MSDLRLNEIPDDREQPNPAGGDDSGPQRRSATARLAPMAAVRQAVAPLTPRTVWRNHRLFVVLAVVSLVPRVLATLAFRPALLTADSFLYMQEATVPHLGTIRPSGYSLLLWLVRPLPHPLLVITTLQHLMMIAVAAIVYGLLRYWGLPGWGASLAAVPVLFDTRQIALESYILPDTLFTLTVLLAVVLLITKRTPGRWQCVLAGLLLAYASLLRGNGLPLAVVAAGFLLIRRVGWRALAAGTAAFVLPVLAYALTYHSEYGQFNITSSSGIFLWSRTTSFANCAVIRPPPRLAPLCPNREKSVAPLGPAPAWSVPALLDAPTPADFIWASDAWWRHDAHPGFNAYNDKLGRQFALAAIRAQPLDYLRVSARDIAMLFLSNDRPQTHETMSFTVRPHIPVLPSYYRTDISRYAGTTSNTHPVQPYAYFLFLYQLPVYFPGFVFLLVVVTGLAGVVRNWRRWGGPAALPWGLAVTSIVVPALITQDLYRYAMVAIPFACVAAGLAFTRVPPGSAPAGRTPVAADGPRQSPGQAAGGPGAANAAEAPQGDDRQD